MKTDLSEQEQSLRAQVEDSEKALAALQGDLQAVDAELKDLAEQSVQYDTLGEVCRSLEALDDLGAMRLFWQDRGHGGDPRRIYPGSARQDSRLRRIVPEDGEPSPGRSSTESGTRMLRWIACIMN